MNFLALFKTPNFENARERSVQPTRPNFQRQAVVALGALFFTISAQDLFAQVGDNNPGGHSGIFNGQVNTGCSYDPYTGNATRSITDIAVAGAVGEYPLALVRTANSRAPSTTEVFGWAGGWNHNYNWILEDSARSQTQNFHPASYTVEFPDGRVETFTQVNWDTTCYRARASNGGAGSSAGVRERFVQLDLNTLFAYLTLPEGGKVEFRAVRYTNANHNRWWYKYHATAIYDPYGLKTQLVSSTTPSGLWRRLDWVIEPAGRSLHFVYTGPNSPRIASVSASDGRTVNYYYAYCNGCRLDHVVYYNNTNWTARYQYTGANIGLDLPPLLWTADDPMYPGPMKRIGYVYRTANNPDGTTPAYGQVQSENYYDGTTVGSAVSTLTVGESPNITYKRKETRGDNKTRTFTYDTGGYLTACTDFMNHGASQGYDSYKYVNYVIDRNNHRTDYSLNWLTGNMAVTIFPLTMIDTPGQQQQPTIQYSYGWSGCADPNNRDGNSPYFICTTSDEGGHVTQFWRDTNKRVTRIDFPDGGYETFTYDAAHFYQLNSHRMTTGGTETFAYDGLHRLQYYSDPYHTNPDNPSNHYFYDGHGWINGIYDSLSHPTNWTYNDRGQVLVMTLATDPVDNTRHTIANAYNADGTLQSRTDQLGNVTSYTYDDYRRPKSVTPPARGDSNGTHTTSYFYDANGAGDDYRYTDSNVTWVRLPSGKPTKTVYDDNRRKLSVTAGLGTGDGATTNYAYDALGNMTWLTNPRGFSTHTIYDERNRPSEIHDALDNITYFKYDTAGRKKSIARPNGQVITNVSFDNMNRVTRQDASNSPGPTAVTQYTYFPGSGLLNTVTDPHNTTDSYTYSYDLMGRKAWVTYPAESNGHHSNEHFTYDDAGRMETFKNRNGNVQTFTYDALNRVNWLGWDDNGLTPTVHLIYDAASRLTDINNANANIHRLYWGDNSLRQETETILLTGGRARSVSYTYDADSNRATTVYPNGDTLSYTYTGRNQLANVNGWATYEYDPNGNLTSRTLDQNGTHTDYAYYDALDRLVWLFQYFNGTDRGFNYGYDNVSVGNRLWTRRSGTGQGDVGDVFKYDLADQVIGVQLNVNQPQNVGTIPWTIGYDANGNRTSFWPYNGTSDAYTANNLSQYTQRTRNGTPASAVYNVNGGITQGFDGSTYQYDAQNRLTQATKGSVTRDVKYDGLNRQVSRSVNGDTTFNVWDGWDLLEEYQAANQGAMTARYVYGTGGLIVTWRAGQGYSYYYQDGSGSTSHLTNASGQLLEWYRYDLQGTPFIYDANNNLLSASALGVRHLFTGQQWYSDIGLYDLRNRFYSPDLGRFLQPDPIGFSGDATNLYRYCGNNPLSASDPMGLDTFYGNRYLSSSTAVPWNVWSIPYSTHTFVFTTNANGTLASTYSWGTDSIWNGTWISNYAPDVAAANALISSGGGSWQGGGSLDYYVQRAYNVLSREQGHLNGGIMANCKTEAQRLVETARYMQNTGSTDAGPPDNNPNRVIVYAPPVYESTSSGGPSWGNGVGIFDTTGFNAVYTPNFYGYTGSLPTTLSNPFGSWGSSNGGSIGNWITGNGQIIATSLFGPNNFYSGLNPTAAFGHLFPDSNPVGVMEPCFVAGTPILMADGSEKPIESIQVGEAVMAWNEETKTKFSTIVVKALHHEEKPQTLFDIELSDGRSFTVNNDHPMYVVEDGDFVFTDELAGRFAKGKAITFQDNKNQPVSIASLRMRKETCKMYNLYVDGQGKSGHTYYASGILVHNFGAGFRQK